MGRGNWLDARQVTLLLLYSNDFSNSHPLLNGGEVAYICNMYPRQSIVHFYHNFSLIHPAQTQYCKSGAIHYKLAIIMHLWLS